MFTKRRGGHRGRSSYIYQHRGRCLDDIVLACKKLNSSHVRGWWNSLTMFEVEVVVRRPSVWRLTSTTTSPLRFRCVWRPPDGWCNRTHQYSILQVAFVEGVLCEKKGAHSRRSTEQFCAFFSGIGEHAHGPHPQLCLLAEIRVALTADELREVRLWSTATFFRGKEQQRYTLFRSV